MTSSANTARREVLGALRAGIPASHRVVLAVSGGRDSMVLLDAALRTRRPAVVAVATFDHGTGSAAREASQFVARVAAARGIPVIRARGRAGAATEAAWRAARWDFLREAARANDAVIATAHTRDDQIETVFIRALRGAGARGLAGLYAPSAVRRPLLGVPRTVIAEYASVCRVQFIDDPTNLSRRYLRNRARLDLLPALERAHPGFGDALLSLSRRAAEWRAEVERVVDAMELWRGDRCVYVAADALARFAPEALALLWPAVAARAGVTLDRRGTERLALFSRRSMSGGRVQLAGGHEVVRHARAFEIRPARVPVARVPATRLRSARVPAVSVPAPERSP